jgi:hypothetical protein
MADRSASPIHSGVVLLAGVAALALGASVYLLDRNLAHVMLWPQPGWAIQAQVFGSAGHWLPSLLHPLGFGLLSATLFSRQGGPGPYLVCLGWGVVNIVFEVGQHAAFSARLADWAMSLGGGTAPGKALAAFFLDGHYDAQDIAAAIAGTLLAIGLLRQLNGGAENAK